MTICPSTRLRAARMPERYRQQHGKAERQQDQAQMIGGIGCQSMPKIIVLVAGHAQKTLLTSVLRCDRRSLPLHHCLHGRRIDAAVQHGQCRDESGRSGCQVCPIQIDGLVLRKNMSVVDEGHEGGSREFPHRYCRDRRHRLRRWPALDTPGHGRARAHPVAAANMSGAGRASRRRWFMNSLERAQDAIRDARQGRKSSGPAVAGFFCAGIPSA